MLPLIASVVPHHTYTNLCHHILKSHAYYTFFFFFWTTYLIHYTQLVIIHNEFSSKLLSVCLRFYHPCTEYTNWNQHSTLKFLKNVNYFPSQSFYFLTWKVLCFSFSFYSSFFFFSFFFCHLFWQLFQLLLWYWPRLYKISVFFFFHFQFLSWWCL